MEKSDVTGYDADTLEYYDLLRVPLTGQYSSEVGCHQFTESCYSVENDHKRLSY